MRLFTDGFIRVSLFSAAKGSVRRTQHHKTPHQNIKECFYISWYSIAVNVFLSLGKFVAGIFGHSAAMVSDAIHSASDVFATFIVMAGIKISGKASDEDHQYGHERLECVASILLSVILGLTGLAIGYAGIEKIMNQDTESIAIPTFLPLAPPSFLL